MFKENVNWGNAFATKTYVYQISIVNLKHALKSGPKEFNNYLDWMTDIVYNNNINGCRLQEMWPTYVYT